MNTTVLRKPEKKDHSSKSYTGIDQLIHDVLFGDEIKGNHTRRVVRPNANIIEGEKEIILELAVPGLSKKDIQLQLHKMQLKVFAKITENTDKDSKRYIRKGFDYNSFERIFTLSEEIDTEHIEANYNKGILRVHLPKKESFGPKNISIK